MHTQFLSSQQVFKPATIKHLGFPMNQTKFLHMLGGLNDEHIAWVDKLTNWSMLIVII